MKRFTFRRPRIPGHGWRYATRTTLAVLITWLSLRTFGMRDPLWALYSVIVVSEPHVGGAIRLGMERAFATLVGAATGLAAFCVFGHELLALAAAVFSVIVLAAYALHLPGNWKIAPLTAALVVGTALLAQSQTWSAALWPAVLRFLEVLYGIFVAVVVGRWVLPDQALPHLQHALADNLGRCQRFYQHVGSGLFGTPLPHSTLEQEKRAIRQAIAHLHHLTVESRQEQFFAHPKNRLCVQLLGHEERLYEALISFCRIAEQLPPLTPTHPLAAPLRRLFQITEKSLESLQDALRNRLNRLAGDALFHAQQHLQNLLSTFPPQAFQTTWGRETWLTVQALLAVSEEVYALMQTVGHLQQLGWSEKTAEASA